MPTSTISRTESNAESDEPLASLDAALNAPNAEDLTAEDVPSVASR